MTDATQQSAESRELEYLLRTGRARYYRGYVIEFLDNGRCLALSKGHESLFAAESAIDERFDDPAYEHDETDERSSYCDCNDEHRLTLRDLI